MNKQFMLNNETAVNLYAEVNDLPIIDYHCHLSLNEILENKPIESISKIWLSADHYKWRLMRCGGVDERFITGNASDYEKFEQYMNVLCYAIGSPLYHFSKMELKKYFGVEDEILTKNIQTIYEKANKAIKENNLTPQKILELSRVEKVCIVEDALSGDLSNYKKLSEAGLKTVITPILRVDKLLTLSLAEIKQKLTDIMAKFLAEGCNSADFGMEYIADSDEDTIEKYSYVLDKCYQNNFAVQLHFGPMRNNYKQMFDLIGPDTGYDSISEKPYLSALVKILNRVSKIGKTVIFNLNPADNAKIATLTANYAGGGIKGKVQMGAAWWFNDNKDGVVAFFKSLSNMALLSSSVGMLTDSRSLISYPRHDYFRRLLCNYVGEIAEKGEFTTNFEVLKKIVCDVCYYNAKEFCA